jgi:hypothetical protein
MRCLVHFLRLMGYALPDAEDISIQFSRNLPVNKLEVAQTIREYETLLPKKLLLGQIPFVEDVDQALREMEAEQR